MVLIERLDIDDIHNSSSLRKFLIASFWKTITLNIVKIFLEDSKKATRYHKDKKEVLEKYGESFPELELSTILSVSK